MSVMVSVKAPTVAKPAASRATAQQPSQHSKVSPAGSHNSVSINGSDQAETNKLRKAIESLTLQVCFLSLDIPCKHLTKGYYIIVLKYRLFAFQRISLDLVPIDLRTSIC